MEWTPPQPAQGWQAAEFDSSVVPSSNREEESKKAPILMIEIGAVCNALLRDTGKSRTIRGAALQYKTKRDKVR